MIHPDVRTEVETDSTLIFTCLAIGRPLPFINWTNNGTTLVNNSTVLIYWQLMTEGGITFVRSILQTCATNSNNYRCIANNTVGVGVFNFGFDLNLEGKCQLINWLLTAVNLHCSLTETVSAKVVIHPGEDTHTDIGTSVVLTCVGYGVPLPALTWKHNETVVQNSSQFFINEYTVNESQSAATFLVSSLTVCNSGAEDAGNFSCTSRNTQGNEVYTSVLTVMEGGEWYTYSIRKALHLIR